MSAIDVAQLLREVSAESPCGPDLEYDPAFHDLELMAAGKPERRIGESVIPAEEPNWRDVKEFSLELLGRTKDVRVAVHLTRALLETDGFPAFREGLALIHALLERYWDDVHPHLDAADNNDPTLRVNSIAALADRDTFMRSVREHPLVDSPRLGGYSLRDIEIAEGTLPNPAGDDTEPPEMSTIESAFSEAQDGLLATSGGLRGALEEVARIGALVSDKVGASRSVDLSPLASALKGAERVLARYLPQAEGGGEAGEDESSADRGRHKALSGEIASREDVKRVLDKACEYFRKHEPSSPVPLLLQRAKRLIDKDFLDIVKDLAPGGVGEVRGIGGLDTEE